MLLPDDRLPRHLLRTRSGFCPYSLGDWIRICQKAKVPHVPAVHVVDFERNDVMEHQTAGPHQVRLDKAYAAVNNKPGPGWMIRWDCGASANLKLAMSDGRSPDAETLEQLPIDFRILELLRDYPRFVVPVWRRPWLGEQMMMAAGYPVEYRAFVKNGALIGISSYYPQRPLPRIDHHIASIESQVAALLAKLKGPFEWPARHTETMRIRAMLPTLKGTPTPDGVHFTADFAATTHGMLFLEGGPPHFMGAHPCCFRPDRIAGVALDAEHRP